MLRHALACHVFNLTLPLMMPRLRERRAAASAVAGLGASLMPSGAFGLDSLPPMLYVCVCV
jgi:hypothetical protein